MTGSSLPAAFPCCGTFLARKSEIWRERQTDKQTDRQTQNRQKLIQTNLDRSLVPIFQQLFGEIMLRNISGQKIRKTERQKDIKTERQKDRKIERQKDRKTERQKDRKTERQKDRMTKKTERPKKKNPERHTKKQKLIQIHLNRGLVPIFRQLFSEIMLRNFSGQKIMTERQKEKQTNRQTYKTFL